MFGIRRKIDYTDFANICRDWFWNRIYKDTLLKFGKPYEILIKNLTNVSECSFKNELSNPSWLPLEFKYHLDCIEFIVMMEAYRRFAGDTYIKDHKNEITPGVYDTLKMFCLRNSAILENGDRIGDVHFEKEYEYIITSQQELFLAEAINHFNSAYTKETMQKDEIKVLTVYFNDEYTYWSKKFRGIKLYHRPRGGITHSGFDIGSM